MTSKDLFTLSQYCSAYNLSISSSDLRLMLQHLDLVIEKNKVINLTRITDYDSALILHILDSLLLLPAVSKAPDGSYLDLGTGAGFPGIPLAVASKREALLIDSVGKKVSAVNEFVEALGLCSYISGMQIRAEELALRRANSFACITARAVAQTNTLIEYAAPLLINNGCLVVAKAHIAPEELNAAQRAAQICGLERVSRETFELPNELGHREVLTYQKQKKSSIKLPRKTGMAQHHPLGVEE